MRLPATAPAAPRRIRPYNPDWTRAAGVAAAAALVVSAVGVASVRYWARIDATTPAGGPQPEPILSVATIDPTVLASPSLEGPVARSAPEAVAAASAIAPAPPAPARAPAPARRTPRAKRPASPTTPSPAPAGNAAAEPEPAPLTASHGAVVVAPTAMPQAPTAATTAAWSPAGGSTFEPNQVDVRPQVVHSVDPQYPEQLRERGSSDVVVVRVLVSPDGRPADARVLRPSRVDPAFDRAALAAVTEWRFSPARRRDRPVACWFNVGLAFRPAPERASH